MSRQKQFLSGEALTPAVFYILMSLAVKDRHGYEIMKEVEKDSEGKVTLGPGTLYGAIKRMVEGKLLIEVETGYSRRKYYHLTEKGRSIFLSELQRYDEAVTLAKKKKLLMNPLTIRLSYV